MALRMTIGTLAFVLVAVAFAVIGPADPADRDVGLVDGPPIEVAGGFSPGPDTDPRAEPPAMRVASQTATVGPRGEWLARIDIDDDIGRGRGPNAPTLVVTVHDRLTSRSAFQQAIADGPNGGTIHQTSALLPRLGRDAAGSVNVRLGLTSEAESTGRIRISQEGVYPVAIRLIGPNGEERAALTTFIVRLPVADPETPPTPLRFAWILPIHQAPSFRSDGTVDIDADSGSALDLIEALARSPEVGIIVAPTPETIDALANTGDVGRAALDQLAERAAVDDVLALPYVRVDADRRSAAALDDLLTAGAATVTEALADAEVDRDTWVVSGPTRPATLDALVDIGIDRFVLDEAALVPVATTLTLAEPFQVTSARDAYPALVSDAGLRRHVDNPDAVLGAHHLLADLAVLRLDEPAVERVVTLTTDSRRPPAARFIQVALAGLNGSSIVNAVGLDEAFATAATEPLIRDVVGSDDLVTDPAATLRRQLASLDSMIGSKATADIARLIRIGASADLSPTERNAYLVAADGRIDDFLAAIAVPDRRTVTLTARDGEIPITMRNDSDVAVTVDVRLESDRLRFPGGAVQRLELPPGNTTTQIPVEAQTSGAFPLDLIVTSPDGGIEIGDTRYTIRSTAVSGVGLFVTVAAVAVLAVWWMLHMRRRPRKTPDA